MNNKRKIKSLEEIFGKPELIPEERRDEPIQEELDCYRKAIAIRCTYRTLEHMKDHDSEEYNKHKQEYDREMEILRSVWDSDLARLAKEAREVYINNGPPQASVKLAIKAGESLWQIIDYNKGYYETAYFIPFVELLLKEGDSMEAASAAKSLNLPTLQIKILANYERFGEAASIAKQNGMISEAIHYYKKVGNKKEIEKLENSLKKVGEFEKNYLH